MWHCLACRYSSTAPPPSMHKRCLYWSVVYTFTYTQLVISIGQGNDSLTATIRATRQTTGWCINRLDRALDVTMVVKDTYWKQELRTGCQTRRWERKMLTTIRDRSGDRARSKVGKENVRYKITRPTRRLLTTTQCQHLEPNYKHKRHQTQPAQTNLHTGLRKHRATMILVEKWSCIYAVRQHIQCVLGFCCAM